MKEGYIYILSSQSRRLYIGVTSNLAVRVWEHKQGVIEGFTNKSYGERNLVGSPTLRMTAFFSGDLTHLHPHRLRTVAGGEIGERRDRDKAARATGDF